MLTLYLPKYEWEVSGVSVAAGLNSGRFDRKRNSKKSEYRIMNIEFRMSK